MDKGKKPQTVHGCSSRGRATELHLFVAEARVEAVQEAVVRGDGRKVCDNWIPLYRRHRSIPHVVQRVAAVRAVRHLVGYHLFAVCTHSFSALGQAAAALGCGKNYSARIPLFRSHVGGFECIPHSLWFEAMDMRLGDLVSGLQDKGHGCTITCDVHLAVIASG